MCGVNSSENRTFQPFALLSSAWQVLQSIVRTLNAGQYLFQARALNALEEAPVIFPAVLRTSTCPEIACKLQPHHTRLDVVLIA
jgi:hypothetical protein